MRHGEQAVLVAQTIPASMSQFLDLRPLPAGTCLLDEAASEPVIATPAPSQKTGPIGAPD